MIIPLPAKVNTEPGEFILTPRICILADTPNLQNAEFLQDLLAPPTGFEFRILTGSQTEKRIIHLYLDPKLQELGREGYMLKVIPDAILIGAYESTGVFYGIQTLRQLLPIEIEERHPISDVAWRIPCVLIEDHPRFTWRGFMLDEGRHFHGKETVLQVLDLMALQKLNVFHWHLTEDQGWRIEIKKYPKLTEVGSKRVGTSKSLFCVQHDGIPYSGFYSQNEIREIVSYASKRHITIVPEIEMPGHSLAALASYQELSCSGGPFEVATHFGIFSKIYCAGKESVFTFLENILDEIIELFPSQYIHIGGDETPKKLWRNCPACQVRIRDEKLDGEHELQGYFTNRIATYLATKGRYIVGWNEILQDGLAQDVVVQFYLGSQRQLLKAMMVKHQAVVMSSFLDTYLDHSYSLLPLSRAYRYEPVPEELDENEAGNILGLEFPLWSEWVPNRARLEYQTYPRITALAETAWTPKEEKDFKDFIRRLIRFLSRLDLLGIRYASMEDAEPSKIKQLFGFFTLPQPQTKTRE
jgi:hexosaminidase